MSPVTVLAQDAPLEAPTIDYAATAPMLIVFGMACVSVLVEAFLPRHQRWPVQVALTLLTLAGAGLALGIYAADGPAGITTLAGAVAVDPPTLFLWGTLLALSLGSVLLIADRSVEPGGAFVASAESRAAVAATGAGPRTGGGDPPEDRGYGSPDQQATMQTEVFPFTLFALGGMMAFVAANDLLTMFIALEVLSLPLYLMCGLARRKRLLSQEAAVKYFLLGAFSSAFFLYGLALLYGYAGSVRLSDIAEAAVASPASDSLLLGGFALLVVGLLFKGSIGPVPHLDPGRLPGRAHAGHRVHGGLHQGGRVRRDPAGADGGLRRHPLGVARGAVGVAIVSMAIGAVIGLTQTDIKRMIAYSSVAHAGFLLIGAMSITERAVRARCSTCSPTASTPSRCSPSSAWCETPRARPPPVGLGRAGQALAAHRAGDDLPAARAWPASR
jgi:NADH-quinone oxidoreductase subunit N